MHIDVVLLGDSNVARDRADTARIKEAIRSKEAILKEMEANGQKAEGLKKEIKGLYAALRS